MCSARLQNVTSSCTNLAKQSEQLGVLRACDIPKKGQFTACAVSVYATAGTNRKNQKVRHQTPWT